MDPEFAPDDSSLFIQSSPCCAAKAAGQPCGCGGAAVNFLSARLEGRTVLWKRAAEIGERGATAVMFADGVEPDDINQGALGDCYFLAALADAATHTTGGGMSLVEELFVAEHFQEHGLIGVKVRTMLMLQLYSRGCSGCCSCCCCSGRC